MVVNSPLIRPYFLGGWHWGAPLDSHDVLDDEPNLETMVCFCFGFQLAVKLRGALARTKINQKLRVD